MWNGRIGTALAIPARRTMIRSMAEIPLKDMLGLAKRLAGEAADMALASVSRAVTRRKADDSVVTDVDHAIQDHILDAIAGIYPDHAVLAEETISHPDAHAEPARARFCWVIDPLDGTRNYASGFPVFATSIAVLDRGRPVVGVVLEHNIGQLYAAVVGEGAMLNGKPIQVGEPATGDDWLIGIPSSKDRLTVRVLNGWIGVKGLILRNLGSTATHLAMVASGALDAAFAKQCKIWDIAAGHLLITEAGGRITDAGGVSVERFDLAADPHDDLPFLAGSLPVHTGLMETVRAAIR